MASCHKLTLEDSHDRGPLPWFGGDNRARPEDDTAAKVFNSLQGALHDPQRWGLSPKAIGTWGERLYEFWQRFRGCCKTSTGDTSGHAYPYLRGQLTMDGERNFANMARHMSGADGQALPHFVSNAPGSGPEIFRQLQAEITAPPALHAAAGIPPSSTSGGAHPGRQSLPLGHHIHVRQTERGCLEADFAIRQVWTVAEGERPRVAWLVIRRDAEGDGAYTLRNAPAAPPAPYLMAGSCQRYCTERPFEDAQTESG